MLRSAWIAPSTGIRCAAVPLGRDRCEAAAFFHIFTNEIGVIAFCQQRFGGGTFRIHDGHVVFAIGDFVAAVIESVEDRPGQRPAAKLAVNR